MFIGLFSSSSTSRLLSSRATESSRIINGQAADVAAYPFLVSIRQFEDGFFAHCGGSVLRPNVVLTAAHCVTPPRTNPNEPFGTPSNSINNFLMPVVLTAADVPAGDPNSVPATGLVKTKAVVTSAGWNETNYVVGGFDLALLLLEEDLVGVETVKLPEPGTTFAVGEPLTIAGWGTTSPIEGTFITPPTLMEAQVESIPAQTCLDMYEAYFEAIGFDAEAFGEVERLVAEDMWVCAQGALENDWYTDFCFGDSGSPLSMIDGNGDATVVGIVSFIGLPCGNAATPTPGVYTNVAKFSSWIERWLDVWERMGQVAKV